MIEELKQDIDRLLRRYQCHSYERYIGLVIVYFIYAKYLCEKGILAYEEAIHCKDLLVLKEDLKSLDRVFQNDCSSFNQILRNYGMISSKDLAMEFIQSFSNTFKLHQEEEILFVDNSRRGGYYHKDEFFQYFDLEEKTTYVIEKDTIASSNIEIYKILNEVLGLHNQFVEEEAIDFSQYHYLYLFDNFPKYRFIQSNENVWDKVRKYIYKVDHVILYTKYNKISNFKDGRSILKHVKSIILNGDNAIIWFQRLEKEEELKNYYDKEISIINYDSKKIPSLSKLKEILEKNRKQKDVLVKTSYSEIIHNHMRIGFHLYQLDKNDVHHDINKIVDQNTQLLGQLNQINETVELEVNKLLNR